MKKDNKDTASEIDWSGSVIPFEQRADFTFQATAPAFTGELDWKVYQTFSDGSVVSWDQVPIPGKEGDDSLTPYSNTVVINDLAGTSPAANTSGKTVDSTARTLGYGAVVIGVISTVLALRKRK